MSCLDYEKKGPLAPSGLIITELFYFSSPHHVPSCLFWTPTVCAVNFRSSADNSRRFIAIEFGSKYYKTTFKPERIVTWDALSMKKQTERNSLVAGCYRVRWALRFDGAEEGSCRRLAAPFDGVSGLARKLLCRIWVMQSSLWQACQNKLVCWRQIQL